MAKKKGKSKPPVKNSSSRLEKPPAPPSVLQTTRQARLEVRASKPARDHSIHKRRSGYQPVRPHAFAVRVRTLRHR